MTDLEKPAVEQKVKNALSQIRPYLQQDGGDVEYVDMTAEGVVIGASSSCASKATVVVARTPCRP